MIGKLFTKEGTILEAQKRGNSGPDEVVNSCIKSHASLHSERWSEKKENQKAIAIFTKKQMKTTNIVIVQR